MSYQTHLDRRAQRTGWFIVGAAAVFGWWCIWMLVSAIAGCTATGPARPPLPGPISAGRNAPFQVDGVSVTGALRALRVAPKVVGVVRALHQPTSCLPRGGINPYVWPMREQPRVGWPVTVLFTSLALRPYPNQPMWIIWSLRPPGSDLPLAMEAFGMPGCMLAVNPDNVTEVAAGDEGIFSRGDEGAVLFNWTPPAWAAGTRLWAQLLVYAPGETPHGYLLSHGIEILIGS